MKKIRILQFSITNTKGGITQYILNNWRYINHNIFQFDFITFSSHLDYEDSLLAEGCQVFHVKSRAEDDLQGFQNEIRNILKREYDIIHLHTAFWKSTYMEQIAKEIHASRVIIHAHNSGISGNENLVQLKRQHEIIKKQINIDIATDFWACSREAADFLYGDYISKEKIKIMKNAINLQEFAYNAEIRQEYRQMLGLEGCFVIGHVGRFTYEKNHRFLVDVFYEISKIREDARLLLIGKGMLEECIAEQAKSYGIYEKICFLGGRDDVNNLYCAMDVFCMPSLFEGLGIALIEAQQSGLNCLCSKKIPQEAIIGINTKKIDLDINLWKKELLEVPDVYERISPTVRMREAGYDIQNQIKILEKGYLNGK